jgi:hypothetical protein
VDSSFHLHSQNTYACIHRFRGTKNILIANYTIGKNPEGQVTIFTRGMDEIMYILIMNDKERIPIPFKSLSDDSLQGRKPDRDLTEPDIHIIITTGA